MITVQICDTHVALDTPGRWADRFDFIESDVFSATAGELRQFATGGGNTVVTGDVDGNGTGDFQIVLAGAFTLTDGDFVL